MPRRYGQACPVAKSLEVLGERWTLLIVRDLLRGPARFQDLQTSLDGIAPNLLSERLKLMEEHGLIERRLYSERPPRAEYHLSDKGRELGVVGALAPVGHPPPPPRAPPGQRRVRSSGEARLLLPHLRRPRAGGRRATEAKAQAREAPLTARARRRPKSAGDRVRCNTAGDWPRSSGRRGRGAWAAGAPSWRAVVAVVASGSASEPPTIQLFATQPPLGDGGPKRAEPGATYGDRRAMPARPRPTRPARADHERRQRPLPRPDLDRRVAAAQQLRPAAGQPTQQRALGGFARRRRR